MTQQEICTLTSERKVAGKFTSTSDSQLVQTSSPFHYGLGTILTRRRQITAALPHRHMCISAITFKVMDTNSNTWEDCRISMTPFLQLPPVEQASVSGAQQLLCLPHHPSLGSHLKLLLPLSVIDPPCGKPFISHHVTIFASLSACNCMHPFTMAGKTCCCRFWFYGFGKLSTKLKRASCFTFWERADLQQCDCLQRSGHRFWSS